MCDTHAITRKTRTRIKVFFVLWLIFRLIFSWNPFLSFFFRRSNRITIITNIHCRSTTSMVQNSKHYSIKHKCIFWINRSHQNDFHPTNWHLKCWMFWWDMNDKWIEKMSIKTQTICWLSKFLGPEWRTSNTLTIQYSAVFTLYARQYQP